MTSNKTSIIFIFLTVFIDVVGIGIIIPVIPTLLEEITGEGISMAALYGTYLMVAYASMLFLFSPVQGELSDRYGRRPVLLIALLGLSADYLIHAYAQSIAWLIIGRILAGICGASHSVATAYIADISTHENKAKNFGMIGAAFGLGFIVGPAIGGIFGEMNVRLPFFIAAGLAFANFLFGFFFVPESLAKEYRRKPKFSKMLPGVSLFQLNRFSGIGLLILAFFLANIAGQALPATWSFFTIEQYSWDEAQVGYSLSFVGLLVAIVQGGLIGTVVKKFGQRKTIMIGFILWSSGMFLFASAIQPWMLYAFLIPYVLGGVAGPTLQSLVSNQVPGTEQGILQGALTSLTSITTIIGPAIATLMFYYFTKDNGLFYFPGAPYASAGIILSIATLIAFIALKRVKFSDETTT